MYFNYDCNVGFRQLQLTQIKKPLFDVNKGFNFFGTPRRSNVARRISECLSASRDGESPNDVSFDEMKVSIVVRDQSSGLISGGIGLTGLLSDQWSSRFPSHNFTTGF